MNFTLFTSCSVLSVNEGFLGTRAIRADTKVLMNEEISSLKVFFNWIDDRSIKTSYSALSSVLYISSIGNERRSDQGKSAIFFVLHEDPTE